MKIQPATGVIAELFKKQAAPALGLQMPTAQAVVRSPCLCERARGLVAQAQGAQSFPTQIVVHQFSGQRRIGIRVLAGGAAYGQQHPA